MALRMLKSDPEVTKQDIEMARIEQNWSEWCGPNGKPWKPIAKPDQNPVLDVDEILNRHALVAIDSPVPRWRQVLRRLPW